MGMGIIRNWIRLAVTISVVLVKEILVSTVPNDIAVSFDKVDSGVVSTVGFGTSGVITKELFDSMDNKEGDLMYVEGPNCVILKPDIPTSFRNMDYATETNSGGSFENHTLSGFVDGAGNEYACIHQYDSSAYPWATVFSNSLNQNQGGVVWWYPYVVPSNISTGYLTILFTDLHLYLYESGDMEVWFRGNKIFKGSLSENYWQSNTAYNGMKCLMVIWM